MDIRKNVIFWGLLIFFIVLLIMSVVSLVRAIQNENYIQYILAAVFFIAACFIGPLAFLVMKQR